MTNRADPERFVIPWKSRMATPGTAHVRNEMLAFDAGTPVKAATSISNVRLDALDATGRYHTWRESGTLTCTTAPTPDPLPPRMTFAANVITASRSTSIGTVNAAEYRPTAVLVGL